MFHLRAALLVLFLTIVTSGHVGTLDTFFVGRAGPYRVLVTVRPPGIVPGLAQITIRVEGARATGVTTQAAQWNVGSRGAPPPDAAARVPGDSALWSSQLWLMTRGSYAVNVAVDGDAGKGTVTVPLSNQATRRLPMPSSLGWVLVGLSIFLAVGLLTIVGAAARESVLVPGEEATASRRTRARVAMVVAAGVIALALSGGRAWWSSVDTAYASGLYRPMGSTMTASDGTGPRVLRLTITDSGYIQRLTTPLIPDHGKLVHLFLVREPANDALAHLHPRALDSLTFEAGAGTIPDGAYRYFADVVHESGYAETMTGRVELGAPNAEEGALSDPDDALFIGSAGAGVVRSFDDSSTITRESADTVVTGADLLLRFTVRDESGEAATLEPYLGMPGHAIVQRDDGSVFVHLHSNGSFSMAAQRVLSAVERGDTLTARRANVPRPRLDDADSAHGDAMSLAAPGNLEFPFAFPRAGRYLVWVQFRRAGTVRTAAFTITAADPTPSR